MEIKKHYNLGLTSQFMDVVQVPPSYDVNAICYFPNEEEKVRLMSETDIYEALKDTIDAARNKSHSDREKKYYAQQARMLLRAYRKVQHENQFNECVKAEDMEDDILDLIGMEKLPSFNYPTCN